MGQDLPKEGMGLMFYGLSAGQDALFALGLEHNEDHERNLLLLGPRAGQRGAQNSPGPDSQQVVFSP